MKYCIACERLVEPKRKFSLPLFLLGFGFLYVFIYPFQPKRCPICNGTAFTEIQKDSQK